MSLPPPEAWISGRRQRLLACLLLFLASVLLYSPTLTYDFVKYDDFSLIGGHPQLYANGTVTERLKQIVFLDYPRLEPLIVRDITWLADSVVFGFYRPFGYHYGNVIYHSLALVVAFLLLLRLTNPPTALISAGLLLVLAAHVEPVAWIMGRKDILSTLFSLLSILMFMRFQNAQKRSSMLVAYLASLLFAAAAFLSKINAVFLPGVIFLCALINEKELWREAFEVRRVVRVIEKRLLQVLPILILALAIFIWYRSVLDNFGIFQMGLTYSLQDVMKLVFIANPLILLEYLKIVLFPWDLEAFYTSPSLFSEFSAADIAVAIMVPVVLVALLVSLWRVSRDACLLFLCFLAAMLPYANWVHFGFWYANRYAYFASFFLIAALASLLVALFKQTQLRWLAVGVALLLGWVFMHNLYYRSQYIGVWKDGVSLWEHEVSIPGTSIADYIHLTNTYLGMAQDSLPPDQTDWIEKARNVNEQVFEMDVPEYEKFWLPEAHYQRGVILTYLDAPLHERLQAFLAAANADEGFSRAQWNTAMILYQMADKESNAQRRLELAEASLVYFQRSFIGREESPRARAERQMIYDQFNSDFPELIID